MRVFLFVILLSGCHGRVWVRNCEHLDGEFPIRVSSWTQFCDADVDGTPCTAECHVARGKELSDAVERSKYQCHHGVGKKIRLNQIQDFYGVPCEAELP